MFTLHPHQWARARTYASLIKYTFRKFLLKEDIKSIEKITAEKLEEFYKEGLPIYHNNQSSRVVGINCNHTVDNKTGHVHVHEIQTLHEEKK